VPVMILLLAVGPYLLPEYRDEKAGRIDLASAALSLVAVLATIYGIKHIAVTGADWQALVSIVAGILVGAVFVVRQLKLDEPLIDLALFSSRAFTTALVIYILGVFAAFGTFMLTAQYMQLALGLDPLIAGLWTMPSAVGFIVGSMLTPALAGKMRPAHVMAAGYGIAAVSFLMLAYSASVGSLWLLVAGYFVMSFGLAPIFTLSTDLIVGSVPPERAGVASGLAETSSEFGGALGIAVLGSVVTALYASTMAGIDLNGLTGQAAQAARETIGGAITEGATVGGSAGDLLVAEARGAYAAAFQVVNYICAAVAALAGLVAALVLGRLQQSGEHCPKAECPEEYAA